jgi:hypothetical protein
MKHKPIPLAVALSGLMYWGLLVYWVYDDLKAGMDTEAGAAAVYGIVFSLVYVAYLMACFMNDLPEGIKSMPVIGRYGKLIGWLALIFFAAWYVRPSDWGGYDQGVGFYLVGICLLGFGAAAIITCFLWGGDDSSRLYALRRFVDVYFTITKPE